MTTWPDHRILDLLGIEVPIIQAPMARAVTAPMAVAVARAGGLASLPCALLSPDRVREEVKAFRCDTSSAINLNFFCHASPSVDAARDRAWQQRLLASYYAELGLGPIRSVPGVAIDPFGAARLLNRGLRALVTDEHHRQAAPGPRHQCRGNRQQDARSVAGAASSSAPAPATSLADTL